jgi:hypothetical protein
LDAKEENSDYLNVEYLIMMLMMMNIEMKFVDDFENILVMRMKMKKMRMW